MEFFNNIATYIEGNNHWVLTDANGQTVKVGTLLKSERDEQQGKRFEIRGGTPPHKPSSTGKVYGKWVAIEGHPDVVLGADAEYYPQVFNLSWVEHNADLVEKIELPAQKTDEPSGQLIGVILTAMIKDGITIEIEKQVKGLMSDYIRKDEIEFHVTNELDNRSLSWGAIETAIDDRRGEIKTLVAATLADLVEDLEKNTFDADDHADDIRDVVLDSFEIDDHFDITNYRDEIEEMAKEGLGDVEDNVKAALNDLIDSGKLALTLSNY